MFTRRVPAAVAAAVLAGTLAGTMAVGSPVAGAVPPPGCARKITVAPVSAWEGTPAPRGGSASTPFAFTVTTKVVHRAGAGPCPVAAANAHVATAHDTTDGVDLVPVSSSLSWAAGDVSSRTVVVSVRKDPSVECDETFALRVTTVSRTPALLASGPATILNDDHSTFRGWHCSG